MANINEKTIGNLLIIQVDEDPSVSGVAAATGSLALLDNGTGGIWQKTNDLIDTAWVPVGESVQSNSTTLFEDWISNTVAGNLGWGSVTNQSGSQIVKNTVQVDAGHPGVVSIIAGKYSTAYASLNLGTDRLILGGGPLVFEYLVQVPVLAQLSDDYVFRVGLGDSTSTDFNNGVYFEYNRGVSGSFWAAKCAAGGVSTSTVGSVGLAPSTWFRLNVAINENASSASFSVASSGGSSTSIATITTNIPNGAGQNCGPVIQLNRGGLNTMNPKSVYLDYFSLYQTLNSAR